MTPQLVADGLDVLRGIEAIELLASFEERLIPQGIRETINRWAPRYHRFEEQRLGRNAAGRWRHSLWRHEPLH